MGLRDVRNAGKNLSTDFYKFIGPIIDHVESIRGVLVLSVEHIKSAVNLALWNFLQY